MSKTIESLTADLLNTTICICTDIILGHPLDIEQIDMNKIPSTIHFVSDINAKQGEFLIVKDLDLKTSLCEFCKDNPDRCWKGKLPDMEVRK